MQLHYKIMSNVGMYMYNCSMFFSPKVSDAPDTTTTLICYVILINVIQPLGKSVSLELSSRIWVQEQVKKNPSK